MIKTRLIYQAPCQTCSGRGHTRAAFRLLRWCNACDGTGTVWRNNPPPPEPIRPMSPDSPDRPIPLGGLT